MIQVRKRWPILAGLVASVTYGANHYRIAGIEHLRLEPLPKQQMTASDGYPSQSILPSSNLGNFAGTATPSASQSSVASERPPWTDSLSVGEKLAVLEQHVAAALTPKMRIQDSQSLPTTDPIPLPPGLRQESDGSDLAPIDAGNLPSTFEAPAAERYVATQTPSIPARSFTPSNAAQDDPIERLSTMANLFGSKDSTPAARMASGKVRIGSFNLSAFGPAKLAKPAVSESLVLILRKFDVVALQEIESSRDDVLPLLIERLNQSGRHYDYIIGPRVGRGSQRQQFAFVFDTDRVETDRYQLYTVDDPDDLMAFEPLVGWFRCKGPDPEKAFTFSLAAVRVDESFGSKERGLIPGLISAIQQDGRQEDDWIILGDFAGSSSQMRDLEAQSVRFALKDVPTDIRGENMRSNLLFSAAATTEYSGRSGTIDFLRQFNLSLEQALEISPHMPVWAEFGAIEGANPGAIAPAQVSPVF